MVVMPQENTMIATNALLLLIVIDSISFYNLIYTMVPVPGYPANTFIVKPVIGRVISIPFIKYNKRAFWQLHFPEESAIIISSGTVTDKGRNVAVSIQQCVHLDTSFALSVLAIATGSFKYLLE